MQSTEITLQGCALHCMAQKLRINGSFVTHFLPTKCGNKRSIYCYMVTLVMHNSFFW